jgi:hypothetical protein
MVDRILLWMTFIYLYEFHMLPPCMFDPADSNPGIIVKKVLEILFFTYCISFTLCALHFFVCDRLIVVN